MDNPSFIDQVIEYNKELIRKSKRPDKTSLEEKVLFEGWLNEKGRTLAREFTANPEKLVDIYLAPLFQELSEAKGTFGIFSLSERSDSVTMWSHYSYNHKGFAVGFEIETDFFAKQANEPFEFGRLQ